MAGETVITIVGNLTADSELRTIGSGATVASFTIASTPRTWNRQTNQFEDGQALFMRCSAWRDLADHCAQSLKKGMRVIATGRLQQRSYQAQDGSTAQVTRQSAGQGGFQGRSGGFQGGQQSNQGYGNQGGQGGYAGGQGGYNGGYQGGGAGYSQQSAAPANPSAPAVDPWSNAGASDAGSFSTFGASSDFGGDDSDPEF